MTAKNATSFAHRRSMSTLFRLAELSRLIKTERLKTFELAMRLEAPERTIGRDIRCLREMFEHDIGFKHGYYYRSKPKAILDL